MLLQVTTTTCRPCTAPGGMSAIVACGGGVGASHGALTHSAASSRPGVVVGSSSTEKFSALPGAYAVAPTPGCCPLSRQVRLVSRLHSAGEEPRTTYPALHVMTKEDLYR